MPKGQESAALLRKIEAQRKKREASYNKMLKKIAKQEAEWAKQDKARLK